MIYRASSFVDPLGLEPRMAEPKTAVLPITPWVKNQRYFHRRGKRAQMYKQYSNK